ncbi:MAG: hypothetical protein ACPGR8_06305 [Limisphaerales bacterium]
MQQHVLDEVQRRGDDHRYPLPHPLGIDTPDYVNINAMHGDTHPPTVHPMMSDEPAVQANVGRHDLPRMPSSRWLLQLGVLGAAYAYGPADPAMRAALGYAGAALISGRAPLLHAAVAYAYIEFIGRPSQPLLQFAAPAAVLAALDLV